MFFCHLFQPFPFQYLPSPSRSLSSSLFPFIIVILYCFGVSFQPLSEKEQCVSNDDGRERLLLCLVHVYNGGNRRTNVSISFHESKHNNNPMTTITRKQSKRQLQRSWPPKTQLIGAFFCLSHLYDLQLYLLIYCISSANTIRSCKACTRASRRSSSTTWPPRPPPT